MKNEISKKLEDFRENIKELKAYREKVSSVADLKKNNILRRAVERCLQISLESCLDIGQMIIAVKGLRKPERYREVIEVLGEADVLPKKFAKKFAPAAGFRNILVHKYGEVELADVYKHLKRDIDDFDTFAKCIAKFIKKM